MVSSPTLCHLRNSELWCPVCPIYLVLHSRCLWRPEPIPMLAVLYSNGKGRPWFAIRHGSLLARKSSIEVAMADGSRSCYIFRQPLSLNPTKLLKRGTATYKCNGYYHLVIVACILVLWLCWLLIYLQFERKFEFFFFFILLDELTWEKERFLNFDRLFLTCVFWFFKIQGFFDMRHYYFTVLWQLSYLYLLIISLIPKCQVPPSLISPRENERKVLQGTLFFQSQKPKAKHTYISLFFCNLFPNGPMYDISLYLYHNTKGIKVE